MQKQNLAARAGRWSAQHRKKAIFGWLVFVDRRAPDRQQRRDQDDPVRRGGPDRRFRAPAQIVKDSFPQTAGEQVLIQSQDREPDRPRLPRRRQGRRERLAAQKDVTNIKSPLRQGQRARSRATATPRS